MSKQKDLASANDLFIYLFTYILTLFSGMIIHSGLGVAGASAANEKKGLAQLARMSSFMGLSEPAHGAHLTHQTHQCLHGTGLTSRGAHAHTDTRTSQSKRMNACVCQDENPTLLQS